MRDTYLQQLPSPFESLTASERASDWGIEYTIGVRMARKLDLYPAIKCAFERAAILVPPEKIEREREIAYYILLCYYLGKKYPEVTEQFEKSSLGITPQEFPAYRELLIMVYESYLAQNEPEKAEQILAHIADYDAHAAKILHLSSALKEANFDEIKTYAKDSPYEESSEALIQSYKLDAKSPGKAQLLNAVLPGAGFFYLGQTRSGITSFLINGLFIAATYEFFHRGYVAAGIVTASLETGWYFGGIYGAGQDAKLYNERLWEQKGAPYMGENKLFPILQLRYCF